MEEIQALHPPRTDKRAASQIRVTKPSTEMHDIVLSEATRSAMKELLLEYHRADALKAYGLHPTHKLLFQGLPGCGKTLAASVLATELDIPLGTVAWSPASMSDTSRLVNDLQQVLDFAAHRQSVVLMDDRLLWVRPRDRRPVAAMFGDYNGPSILAVETGDGAAVPHVLRRQFGAALQFGMPDFDAIQAFIKLRLSGVRHDEDVVDDGRVVRWFEGMSYAAIAAVLFQAVKHMVLSHESVLTQVHVKYSVSQARFVEA